MDYLQNKLRVEPTGFKNKIMLVGINPGWRDMEVQDIWETDYGKFIEQMLFMANLNRDDIWMTNLYKYKTWYNRPLTDDEIYIGRAELIKEIVEVNPRLIVLMGKVVIEQFSGVINKETSILEIPVFSIHHPSYARRWWNKTAEQYILNFKTIKQIYARQSKSHI